MLWAGDQASDFWSLRALVTATVSAAHSGFSNWSHGRRLPRPPGDRPLPAGAARALGPARLLHGAHAGARRLAQEPWGYGAPTLDLYRGYVLLHEMLVPHIRSAAATAARRGLPLVRPRTLLEPDGDAAWAVGDAFGFGPALWVAPVLEEGARERRTRLPRGDWIEAWSGRRVRGGASVVAPAPLHAIPVWVRAGAIVVTHPAEHVARGLGDTPESRRPLVATLWGEPRCGRALARLADGTRIGWRGGRWRVDRDRDVTFVAR